MMKVVVNGAAIVDEASFHKVFADSFGFPAFYGNNLNAWIDCMSYIDDPGAGMTSIHIEPGKTLTIAVEKASHFKEKCPELWLAFLECVAFVNWRRLEQGEPAILNVSAHA
jgi:hypothetical protein